MLRDPETAPISEALRATLVFLRAMTLEPDALGVDHVAATRAAGVDREALRDAIYVATCFNVIVRMADALGFDLLDDEGYAKTAKMLLRFGYRM
ncbi:MAG: hypothetical protein IAG13_31430 [Deltaproteobacteria bacterium]|nr:hypothetical protein [Nannocystaceae bacterium]